MMILSKLRSLAFWSLDAVRGGNVRKAYQEIKRCDERTSLDDTVIEHQRTAFEKLAKHAVATTKFYASVPALNLTDFPVIDKNTIRSKQDDFISSKYNQEKLIVMYTSGSTGTPFASYQDYKKKKRVNAEIIYYSEKAGYSVGVPLVYLRSVVKQVSKSKLVQFLQNQPLLCCNDLSDRGIENFLQSLCRYSKHQPILLIAYASTYDAMRDYLKRCGAAAAQKIRIKGLISGSDMLFDETRAAVEKAFGCKCFSRYSNEENGVLGQDSVKNNVFIINEADYIIEILKMESEAPAEEGELGRIVVTDLFNYAMPMIRYDTGDIGAFEYVTECGISKRAIGRFGGRKMDVVYRCDGERISAFAITNVMWSFLEVRQYQFIQMDRNAYIIKVNAVESTDLSERLDRSLKAVLGDDARISIEYVSEVPVLASGKRRYIVNEMGLSK